MLNKITAGHQTFLCKDKTQRFSYSKTETPEMEGREISRETTGDSN